jgi:hypothetical protein
MDLIVALPPTLDGNTSLMVFVDKVTKMIHIAPCVGQSDAPALTRFFLEMCFGIMLCLLGLSVVMILVSIQICGKSFLGIAK